MADKKFLVNIDLDQNELKNVTLHPLAAVPVATGEDGQLYYDTGDQLTYQYKAGATNAWEVIGGSGTTNLGVGTVNSTTWEITSSSGSSTTLLEATVSNAGLLSAGDWSIIQALDDDFIRWDTSNLLSGGTSPTQATWFLDEDNFASNSDQKVASQQSIKAYVDAAVSGGVNYQGGYNASTNTPDLDTSPSGIDKGYMYTTTVAGSFFGSVDLEIGDVLIAEIDNPTVLGDWTIVERNLTGAVTNTTGGADDNVAFFDGATGEVIKDNSITLTGSNTGDEPNASVTVAGIAEEATDAEVAAGTETGGTGARLFVNPGSLALELANVTNRYEVALTANASQVVTHNLGNRFVTAEVYQTATPWNRVEVVIECTSVNTLTVIFNTAPTASEYTIVVIG